MSKKKKNNSLPGEWAMKNRQVLLAKDNAAEQRLCQLLTRCGVVFNREHVVRCNGNVYYIDAAAEIDGIGLVGIEVDGRQHFTGKGQRNDRKKERDLISCGEVVGVLRLSWPRVMSMSPADLMDAMRCLSCGGVLLLY